MKDNVLKRYFSKYTILSLFLVAIYFITQNFGAPLIARIITVGSPDMDITTKRILLNVYLDVFLLISALGIHFDSVHNDLFELTDNSSTFKKLLKFIICIGIYFAGNIITAIILQILPSYGDSANEDSINTMFKDASNILKFFFLFIIVIAAPILEELVFRKSLFFIFKNKILSVICSGLVFGILHITSEIGNAPFDVVLIHFIPYFISGISFSLMYAITDNIFYSIGMHMTNNFLASIKMFK
jgi:membrane protease YdiL (CAAX protease family)